MPSIRKYAITIELENIRSFAGRHSVALLPLTLLVGENSSGKSTFLGSTAAALDSVRFPFNPALNDPPYSFGSFDTIATYIGGRSGRAKEFSIGYTWGPLAEPDRNQVFATYRNDRGNRYLARLLRETQQFSIELHIADDRATLRHNLLGEHHDEDPITLPQVRGSDAGTLLSIVLGSALRRVVEKTGTKELGALAGLLTRPPTGVCHSIAPIRSKPRRTYDVLSEDYSPEGDHIPSLLARLFSNPSANRETSRVSKAVTEFGNDSGLFGAVSVKPLGKGPTEGFQLRVASGGPPVSIADVGYGVSQSLPIIVESSLRQDSVLLIQQPEVHLHPRAQASLGSFFSRLVAGGQCIVLVETHSDFLVDRVRQEIATGTLDHNDAQILFFQRVKQATEVHAISFDKHGNVQNVPPGYRQFFLQEEQNLLFRTGE